MEIIYDVPRQTHPYSSYKEGTNKNPSYVNVGRTVEMELNSIARHEEATTEEGREEEEARRETHILEVKGSFIKYPLWRILLVTVIGLSFLLSIIATILGAVAVSHQ